MVLILNQIIINLALIVSTVLTCYFLGLKISSNQRFKEYTSDFSTTPPLLIILFGIFIGCSSLVLSSNQIVVSQIMKIDMRYVFVFFSVIYGNRRLGEIATGILIFGKTIEYILAPENNALNYFNNLVLTVFLLIVSIIIKKYKLSLKKSVSYFILVFISTRIIIFSIYFKPILELPKLISMAIYFSIFTSIFLITIIIVNMAVSVASTMNLYRTGSITDHLTNLYNRRMFTLDLNDSFHGSQNTSSTFCLAIIDIDDFKQINDTYGHHIGDQVLKHFSTILKENLPHNTGELYRIGGEEFAFLTYLPREEALVALQEFRERLNQTPFNYNTNKLFVSASIGMTEFNSEVDVDNYEGSNAIYTRADRALYEAKKTGKNKLIFF